MRDFTFEIYELLIDEFLRKGYEFIRVSDYFTNSYDRSKPFIMMRPDVDRKPQNSLEMAKLENKLGVKSTYYFRTIPQTYKEDIIKEIASLGHEIAYHYESLAECNGNYEAAILDFEKNLNKLRKFYPIKNIAMHGRPTSKWDSRDLWKKYDYKKYEILSEPYFDLDFNEIFYTTDAGRVWDNEKVNLRDKVDSKFNFKFSHTIELIKIINSNRLPKKVMINIHPEHWSKSDFEWWQTLIIRKIKNFIKKVLLRKKI